MTINYKVRDLYGVVSKVGMLSLLMVGLWSCSSVNAQVAEPALVITAPAYDYESVSGLYEFIAEYQNVVEIENDILWSIRVGACENYTYAVAGNIDDLSNPSTYIENTFKATVNTDLLAPGNYCFVVDPQVQVAETDLVALRDFVVYGYETTYLIEGVKWNDIDGDGIYGEEPTIPGWEIEATDGEVVLYATTDANGAYSFMVGAGEWFVYEVQQEGWTQTGIIQNYESIYESDVNLACEFTFGMESVPTSDAQNDFSVTCDFGNQEDEEVSTDPEPVINTGDIGQTTGTRIGFRNTQTEGLVLGVTAEETETNNLNLTCSLFLYDFMKLGSETYAWEVMKLQYFLTGQGWYTPATGVFDVVTDNHIRIFQQKYADEILTPWGLKEPTGHVYKTTLWKINNMVCPESEAFPVIE